jgi:hypothetical protein
VLSKSDPGTPLPLLNDITSISEFSLLSTMPAKTVSLEALSGALLHTKPVQLAPMTGLSDPSSRRHMMKKVAKYTSKAEVEMLAAITTSHMSRDTANKLLGLVSCVSNKH